MPRTYKGRARAASYSKRTQDKNINLNKTRNYIMKLLKQSGYALAIILIFYITKQSNHTFYTTISPHIKSAINYNFDIAPLINSVQNYFSNTQTEPLKQDEIIDDNLQENQDVENTDRQPDTDTGLDENITADNAVDSNVAVDDLGVPVINADDIINEI